MRKWDRHSIKAEIYRRGENLTSLAERHGYSPNAVRHVLSGYRWPAVEKIIADFIEVPVEHLFPLPPSSFLRRDSGTTHPRRARRSTRRTSRKSTRTSNRRKVA